MHMALHPMLSAPKASVERPTERVAVLMTPAEKATYADHASRLGLSLGQFFREAGAAYAAGGSDQQAETDALEAQQRRLDDLNGRVIRLETRLEIALNRSPLQSNPRTALDSGGGTSE